MRKYQLLIFIISLGCIACQPYNEDLYFPSKTFQQTGDDIKWSQLNYVDSAWNTGREGSRDSIFWLRMHFDFEEKVAPNSHRGIFLFGFGAQELYWDGVLIGNNGIPSGKIGNELPGKITAYFLIPDSMAGVGNHILALRCSQQFEQSDERFLEAMVDNYTDLLRSPLIITGFMHILGGAYLLAAIYFLFLFLSYRREASVVIFSVICFTFFGLILLEYFKFYVLYEYPLHYTRLEIIGWMTMTVAFLAPLFFGLQFNVPRILWVFGGYLLVLLFFYFYLLGQYDNMARMFGRCMWILSLGIVLYSIYVSNKVAPLILFGLLLSGIIDYFFIYDVSLYVSFTIIVFLMFYLLTVRGKQQRQAYESSLLLSARLKNELLQKHIQPHFIKNTLTSLIDWVEESPKDGVLFIEALAEEFDILSQVAEHQLIPISQEINLCKSHLVVMKYRKEISYQWKDKNIDEHEMIPPALIHTALENGITHSQPNADGSVCFVLHFERGDQTKCYTLYTFSQPRVERGVPSKGTGLQYMESRLTESYGANWEITSQPFPEGWMTQFIIYDK